MPRLPINYKNCVIYKLCCNNINITDTYVGHTTHFRERKTHHKWDCHNENRKKNYNYKVYQFIRANGGWDNWSMIEIEKFPCNDTHEAAARERYWFEALKPTLNTQVPSRTQKEYAIANIETIKNNLKEYRAINAETIREQQKKYRENNADKIKSVTDCECGGKFQHKHKARHLTSKNHLLYCLSNYTVLSNTKVN